MMAEDEMMKEGKLRRNRGDSKQISTGIEEVQ